MGVHCSCSDVLAVVNQEPCLKPCLYGHFGDVVWASASNEGLQQPVRGSIGAVPSDVPIADVPPLISVTCAEAPSGGVYSGRFITLRRAIRSHSPRYWFDSFPRERASCRRKATVSISTVWAAAVICPGGCTMVSPGVKCATVILCVSCTNLVICAVGTNAICARNITGMSITSVEITAVSESVVVLICVCTCTEICSRRVQGVGIGVMWVNLYVLAPVTRYVGSWVIVGRVATASDGIGVWIRVVVSGLASTF